jgi:dipeptidyl aminopeptidase/acylaminoacyl peptidase
MHIWTANASGGDPKRITFSPTYDVEPCWSPAGKQIAYSSYPGSNIMVVPATGGQAEKIAKGFSPSWSPDGKRIAYFSTESSPHTVSIFIKPVNGGEAKRLTCSATAQGVFWLPTMDWSPEGNRLVAMRLVNGTWELAIINTDSDHVESIVPVSGSALFPRWSHDGRWIVFSSMDTGHPSVLRIATPRGELKTEFGEHQQYIAAQFVRYRSGDGLEIPSYLFLPRDRDAGKHPAVVWLHGGLPGATLNLFNPEIQYFVAQGLVVLAPNYRSSAGFGERLATLKSGDDMVQDIVAAANYLKGLKAVDAVRIGVLGQSFGGYLTLLSIARNPDLFAGAVDISGLANLTTLHNSGLYGPQFSKFFGGTPQERPEDYRNASPSTMAGLMKTPLLILHGDADREAPYEQSVEMAEALKAAHKDCEFITYKSAGHGFVGNDEIDAMQQSLRFLSTHLQTKP